MTTLILWTFIIAMTVSALASYRNKQLYDQSIPMMGSERDRVLIRAGVWNVIAYAGGSIAILCSIYFIMVGGAHG